MKRGEFLTEVRGLTLADLQEKARSLAEEGMKLRFRRASGQLESGHVLAEVRRNLARVLTLITEKQKKESAA